jgi:hypothetical protein
VLPGRGLIVFTDSQNRPYTHPRHPLDQRPVSSRASLALASQPRARTLRTLLEYQLPPRAVATPGELRTSAKGVILPAVAATIYGAGNTAIENSLLQSNPAPACASWK